MDAGADRRRAIEHDAEIDRLRDLGAELRQQRGNAVDGRDDVRAGLAIDDQQDRRLAVGQAGVAEVLDAVADVRDVVEPHRRAVAIRDDQRPVLLGLVELVGRRQRPLPIAVGDVPLRAIRVRGRQRRANVLERQAERVQRGRVDLDAHGRQRAAADVDLADALDLRQLLRQHARRDVVQARLVSVELAREREDHDRRVGRVHLAVARVVRQVRRQLAARGVDRGLHVARRRIDVAAQVELHRDRRRAQRARRRHLRDARDLAELLFQRRRDARRHRLRARAGQAAVHADRRELDGRQRRDGQQEVRDRAGQRDRERQQRRADRPLDERRRQAHAVAPAAGAGTGSTSAIAGTRNRASRSANRSKYR